jgi:hypothetical protein
MISPASALTRAIVDPCAVSVPDSEQGRGGLLDAMRSKSAALAAYSHDAAWVRCGFRFGGAGRAAFFSKIIARFLSFRSTDLGALKA